MISAYPTTPQKPSGVQPGGGICAGLEILWGRLRRRFLRLVRPGYVRAMAQLRQGECPGCTHDIIDPRDLKYTRNVCGYSFRPADDRFAWRGHLGFARHGLAEMMLFSLAVALACSGVAWLANVFHPLLWLLLAPFALLWLEIVYFFRDPERQIPTDADALVSPADGVVTNVEEVDEIEFPGKVLRISIFLSIFNVHVNRLPRSGTVKQVRYFPGAYLDARNPDSAVRNEQLWIDMEEAGRPMRVKQISGAIARRIVCWLKDGERVERGARLGMIKLGSRTDLLIPVEAVREVQIKVGDKVQGGSTILLRVR